MKKMLLFLICAVALAAGLVAGGSSSGTESNESDPSEGSTSIANPWSDVASAEDAAKGAGIDGFTVPSPDTELTVGPMAPWSFRCMEGLAQCDGYAGAAELTLRKGFKGDEKSISGDYNEYDHEWTTTVAGKEITCFGNTEGKATKSIWTVGDYSYCILAFAQGDDPLAFGLNEEDLATIAGAME